MIVTTETNLYNRTEIKMAKPTIKPRQQYAKLIAGPC